MDLQKLSIDWAKAELFSAKIVWLFSIIILLSAAGFAYWGKTANAKAFVIPFIVSGAFLMAMGAGLFITNNPRIARFENEFKANANNLLQKEIIRTAQSERELKLVLKILPAIIIAASVLLILFTSANWRAISITVVIIAAFSMVVDSNTAARNTAYHEQLLSLQQHENDTSIHR